MKKIVIAIDFSDKIGTVLDKGLDLASCTGAEVLLLHTEPPADGFVYHSAIGPYGGLVGFGVEASIAEEIKSNKIKNQQHALDLLKEKAEAQGIKTETAVLMGEPASVIRDKCINFSAELLVIGLHKHSFFHNLLEGNTEMSLVKKAPCDIMLIPEKV